MKNILILLISITFISSCALTEKNFFETKDAYLGLTPPGLAPEVFAPGIVSDSNWKEHCQLAFSPNGDEIYWSKFSRGDSEQIYFSKFVQNKWTTPAIADFVKDDSKLLIGQPNYTPGGKCLFFYTKLKHGIYYG